MQKFPNIIINNYGNECYINTIIQTILSLYPLMNKISENFVKYEKLQNKYTYTYLFYKFYSDLDNIEKIKKKLIQKLSKEKELSIIIGRNNDSLEILSFLLNKFQEEIDDCILNDKLQILLYNYAEKGRYNINSNKLYSKLSKSNYNFYGIRREKIICCNCQYESSDKLLIFTKLVLDIIGETFEISEETDQKLENYKCKKCKKYNTCINIKNIEIYPDILIFILNYFTESIYNKKQISNIKVDKNIIINNKNYILSNIILHYGNNPTNGHYISIYSGWSRYTEYNNEYIIANDSNLSILKSFDFNNELVTLIYMNEKIL